VLASYDRAFFEITNPNVYPSTYGTGVAIDGHAGAGVNAGSSFGNGLKVEAIRKAPIPIAQEPI
jgi:hypothetical protein